MRVKSVAKSRTATGALLVAMGMTVVAQAQTAANGPATTGVDEARIESLLKQLTLKEKVSLLSGASSFGTAAIERLGIHAMRFADGPSGVRSNDGDEATAFPPGVTLASTWNPQLLQRVGAAIGEEVRAMGSHVLLGPNLNLTRVPLSGRNFETYGEDPFLAGNMGVGFVRGTQSTGVAVSAKHYIGNEQETERSRGNSVMDARTMHEIYLRPFEMVVKQAHPWTIMTAYNRVNGTFMSEHESLLRNTLKDEWGFDGVAMSDWFGLHSTFAVSAGLDLEMPGPPLHFGNSLTNAVNLFQVESSAVDDAARRMLRLSARVGALDGVLKPATLISTPAHRQLAREVAAQGITLLKNERQMLPLSAERLRTLAVIGPNADALVVQGGGSAQVVPSNLVSPLDAIRTQVTAQTRVVYEQGVDNEKYTPAIDGRDLSPDLQRTQRGLTARYYPNASFSGKPVKQRVEQNVGALLMVGNDVNLQGNNNLSVTWEGYFWPRTTGEYEFEYEYIRVFEGSTITTQNAAATASLKFDGKTLISSNTAPLNVESSSFFPMETRRAKVRLTAGKPYPIRIDYAGKGYRIQSFRVAARQPIGSIEAAVAAARNADTAVVFVGSGSTAESEGRDRASIGLDGEQDALVRAVAAANPNTVVVLNNGAPVAMPWLDQVAAVVEAWLPGQEGALALADILFGKVNPSGKLPVTFPKRLEDTPSYLFYPGFRDAVYGEGIFTGYRYYDKKRVDPLFPFGHGLSYTSFSYRDLSVPKQVKLGEPVTATVVVQNTGSRAGTEVVQLYVSNTACLEACPVQQLKAFSRVELQPGESRMVNLLLDDRAFDTYSAAQASWQTLPGRYTLQVGSSSRDIRVKSELQLVAQ